MDSVKPNSLHMKKLEWRMRRAARKNPLATQEELDAAVSYWVGKHLRKNASSFFAPAEQKEARQWGTTIMRTHSTVDASNFYYHWSVAPKSDINNHNRSVAVRVHDYLFLVSQLAATIAEELEQQQK